jgi:Uma2 family endonuclease
VLTPARRTGRKDLAYEVTDHVEEYLGAGTRLVWVVDPHVRTVIVYRADGSIVGRREKDELDGEDVVPGFRCPVRELFRTPAPPRKEEG